MKESYSTKTDPGDFPAEKGPTERTVSLWRGLG